MNIPPIEQFFDITKENAQAYANAWMDRWYQAQVLKGAMTYQKNNNLSAHTYKDIVKSSPIVNPDLFTVGRCRGVYPHSNMPCRMKAKCNGFCGHHQKQHKKEQDELDRRLRMRKPKIQNVDGRNIFT